ncbi:MAG: sigma-70 family RNA polymerase sigma factor [Ignavibacteriales bacterium]|nr:sigma-70 family RNA polymerase sigma factor [Ignavibacteriales bacterium]
MQEKELIRKILSGDRAAYKEFFDKYNSMVFNVCCRMLGNRHEGEDLTQEVFINAFKSISQFRSDSKITTWLYRIAVNLCLNHQHKLKRMKWITLDFFSSDESRNPDSLTDYSSPDKIIEKKETETVIQNAINSLPENQRIVILLSRYEGLSYEEIAEITGTSISSVESRIFRGKQNLCKKLLPYLNQL